MDLFYVQEIIERLRREVIGAPDWIDAKETFEYKKQTIEVVVILKLIRAAQGLAALDVLCRAGLFVDLGAGVRLVNDCVEEVYFLLENYPESPSMKVQQFMDGFFENIIEGYLQSETHAVPRAKIRSAYVRILKGGQDDMTRRTAERIYKTFCGYVHANYAHIMEIYGEHKDVYNLAGVQSTSQKEIRMEHVRLATSSVLMAGIFAAQKFKRRELYSEMMGYLNSNR
jgi:hypothetical protein